MQKQKTPRFVEYMCYYCGAKRVQQYGHGRPMPGKCPRKQNGRPHTWVVNRKID